jgi:predicted MFS family arabinose efflux permease
VRHLLDHPSFRRLWLAGLLSFTGSEMSRIALLLYLVSARDSVAGVAVLVALKTLAAALVAPAAGVIVDRLDKRTVMIAADLARAVFMTTVLVAPVPPVIYVMATLESMATAIFEPARSATIPLVVARPDIAAANGLHRTAMNLTMMAGPIAGAELFTLAGLRATLAIDVLTYLASAVLIARCRVCSAPVDTSAARPAFADEIREGWDYLRSDSALLQLAWLFFVSMLCGGLWVPIAPFFVRDTLGASERLLGVQLAAFGAGGIVGGLIASRLIARFDKGTVLFGALLGEGALLTLYALITVPSVSSLILFGWGAAVALIGVAGYSIVQTTVEARLLGRIVATLQQGESLAMLLAMYVAVVLADGLGGQVTLLLAGLGYFWMVAGASFTRAGRSLRLTH